MELLIQQEIALHQPEVRSSAAELEVLLHPAFTEVCYSGKVYDYKSVIEALEKESQQDFTIHAQDFHVDKLAADVQLLRYKSARCDEQGGVSRYAMRSSIWVLDDCHWLLRFHQGTPCDAFKLVG